MTKRPVVFLAALLACARPLGAAATLGPPTAPAEPPPPPAVRVYKAEAPPTIDARLGDACWKNAISVHPFVTHPDGLLPAQGTRLTLSYDEGHLYAALRCACPDPELLRVGDGDPTLNDRVALTVQWPGSDDQSVVVDATGRVKATRGLGKVEAAAQRISKAYVVELAVPRRPGSRGCRLVARRYNEVIGEISGWGNGDRKAEATLARKAGPVVKLDSVPRYPSSGSPLKLVVSNPTEWYAPVRCRVTRAELGTSMPHVVRLNAGQSVAVAVQYNEADVAVRGLEIVVDEPSGRMVYVRPPRVRAPVGKAPGLREVDVIPYPRSVVVDPERAPFVVTARCRIYTGGARNEAERRAAQLIQAKLKALTGLELAIRRAGLFYPSSPSIIIATRRTTSLATRTEEKTGLKAPQQCAYQSYAITVSPSRITLVANEDLGTLYGAHTLAQLLGGGLLDAGKLAVPWARVSDWPAYHLRGCLWRGPRPDPAALYPALMQFRVNLLTHTPGARADLAAANGVFLARLTVPPVGPRGEEPQPAFLRTTPSETMPRKLRRSLRLPITVLGTGARPSDQPVFGEVEAGPRVVEEQRTVMVRDEAQPVSVAWVRASLWRLLHTGRQGAGRSGVVGLCVELPDDPLLPPSWARVAAAAEYGWTPEKPWPGQYLDAFYRRFYGTGEVGTARTLLERAVASLPRRCSLAELLDPARPAPGEPRADLAALVREAQAKAARATRNQALAGLLAAAGGRVLAAAANVRTALRLRRLYARAVQHDAAGRRDAVVHSLAAMAKALADGRKTVDDLLGTQPDASADAERYARAAEAVRGLCDACAGGAKLPGEAAFWALLRGETR